ncbi:beta-N-acetylglucosaminidase domain-containing protein [Streptomyces boluensis]|uniref:beta-N-acetylglucosaminidase domain-containing protein n=1 Tax=Streptomyces boluensis TaxID=1775135 RepID=UPI0028AB9911|nr:beta-N-acetylglucosaminidase domain-containing protein [Streptomyces boluensis]
MRVPAPTEHAHDRVRRDRAGRDHQEPAAGPADRLQGRLRDLAESWRGCSRWSRRPSGTPWTRRVFVWDNYPVNDFGNTSGRLLLAPYDKREASLSEHLSGIVANPMNQPYASKVAVFGTADFTWNDRSYDARKSWPRAMSYLAGGDRTQGLKSLRAYATAIEKAPATIREGAVEKGLHRGRGALAGRHRTVGRCDGEGGRRTLGTRRRGLPERRAAARRVRRTGEAGPRIARRPAAQLLGRGHAQGG